MLPACIEAEMNVMNKSGEVIEARGFRDFAGFGTDEFKRLRIIDNMKRIKRESMVMEDFRISEIYDSLVQDGEYLYCTFCEQELSSIEHDHHPIMALDIEMYLGCVPSNGCEVMENIEGDVSIYTEDEIEAFLTPDF